MDVQTLQEVMNSQFLGNTLRSYLVSAAVFFGVFGGLPIAKAIALRHLKTLAKRTTNDFDNLLHDLLRRLVGPFVYLFAALYFATLSLTLPENLSRLLHGLFVIILTVKVAQIFQEIAAYGIRNWAERTAKEDPTSAAMLKNLTLVVRFMIWRRHSCLSSTTSRSISPRSWRAWASAGWPSPWPPRLC